MWTVKICLRPDADVLDIFIVGREPDGGRVILSPDGSVKKVINGIESNPSLRIPTELAPELMAALHRMGVIPPAQSFYEGKLDAMTEHLKDLRKMLKLS